MAEIKVDNRGPRDSGPKRGFNPAWLLPLLLIPLFFLLRGRKHDDPRPVATDTTAVVPATTPMQTDTASAGGQGDTLVKVDSTKTQ